MSPAWEFVQEQLVLLLSTIAISSTGIWLATGIAILACRRTSAATRHRLVAASMVAVLTASALIPSLPIPRWTTWGRWPALTAPIVAEVRPEPPKANAVLQRSAIGTDEMGLMGPIGPMRSNGPISPISPIGPIEPADQQNNLALRSTPMPAQVPGAVAPLPTVMVADADSPPGEHRLLPSLNHFLAKLVWTWIFGCVASAVLFVSSLWRVRAWLRMAIPIESGIEVDRCETLCRKLCIKHPIRIVMSPDAMVPFVSGFWRPVLVLPTGFGQWSTERLNVVLAHELVHVRRADVLWQVIGRCCLIPAWFQPLGWIAMWRLRIECEHACDDAVLLNGEQPCDYAMHLVDLATGIRQRSHSLPAHVVAMAKHSPVEQRVRSILDPSIPRQPVSRWRTWCVSLGMSAAILFLAALSPTRSESKPIAKAVVEQSVADDGNDKLESQPVLKEARVDSPVNSAAKRIEAILDQPLTVEFREGTLLVDVMKSLVRKHRIPVSLEEWSFEAREALFDRISAFEGQDVKLRDVLKSITDAELKPKGITLDLTESHGNLELSASGGAWRPEYEPASLDCCECDKHPVMRLAGTVQDTEGVPVKNALVEVRNGYQLIFAVADAEGRFSVETEYINYFEVRVIATDETTGHSAVWWFHRFPKGPVPQVLPVALVVKPSRKVMIEVMDANETPVARATAGVSFGDFPITEGLEGRTDENGQAHFSLPEDIHVRMAFAAASKRGFDYVWYGDGEHDDPKRPLPKQPEGDVRMKLTGARSVTVKMHDEDNRPVAGVHVDATNLYRPEHDFPVNLALPRRFGREITNQEGIAVFDWLPTWHTGRHHIEFSHSSPNHVTRYIAYDPGKAVNDQLNFLLEEYVPVSGRVVDASGQPSAGAKVSAVGANYNYGNCKVATTTDKDGAYTIKVHPRQVYLFIAKSSDGNQAISRDKITVYPRKPLDEINLQLRPAARVFGRMTIGQNSTPVKGKYIQVHQYGELLDQSKKAPFRGPDDKDKESQPDTFFDGSTDDDGRFEFRLSAGMFGIQGPNDNTPIRFELPDQGEVEFNYHSDGRNWHAVKKVAPKKLEQRAPEPRSAVDRYRSALEDAKLSHKHVLTSFHESSPWLIERTELELHKNFRTVEIILDGADRASAQELAKHWNVELPADASQHLLVMTNESGNILGKLGPRDLTAENLQSELMQFVRQNIPLKTDAKSVLAQAREQARRENKRIIVQPAERSTWDSYLSPSRFPGEHRAIWEQNYIWIVVDESWPSFELAMKPIRKAAKGSLPDLAILDADGKVRATGNLRILDATIQTSNKSANSAEGSQSGFEEIAKLNLERLIEKDLADQKQAVEAK